MSWSRHAFAILLLLGLAACGFRPLYGTASIDPKISDELSRVTIRPINDRIGQLVHNALLTNLNPKGEPTDPRWVLVVAITLDESQQILQKNSTSTRNTLTYTAQYTLVQKDPKVMIDSGTVIKTLSFDFIDQHYSDVTAAASIERRAATAIAGDIRDRLASYFIRRTKAVKAGQATD